MDRIILSIIFFLHFLIISIINIFYFNFLTIVLKIVLAISYLKKKLLLKHHLITMNWLLKSYSDIKHSTNEYHFLQNKG